MPGSGKIFQACTLLCSVCKLRFDGGTDRERRARKKIFNDPIHGSIQVDPLSVKIIDTMQFQRLRFLKQLGLTYFLYPAASHNRFEHSIGVYHLSGEFVQRLKDKQKELNISEKDKLCVQIAGLCHDLGHGPYSHLFDDQFIPKIRPERSGWSHEEATEMMFDHLIEENKLDPEFEKHGLNEKDKKFIKLLIQGLPDKMEKQDWEEIGRDESKSFLFEIVANKSNGIDVDKWDYFARDCYMLGFENRFGHIRYMKFAKVLKAEDGRHHICMRDKEAVSIYDLFQTRYGIYRRANNHRMTKTLERMLVEAMIKADDYILIKGKDRKERKMSECIDDPVAYSKLTDSVFEEILFSDSKELEDARNLLKRIVERKLDKCVLSSPLLTETQFKKVHDFLSRMPEEDKQKIEDCYEVILKFDYGIKKKNPLENHNFSSKHQPDEAFKLEKTEELKFDQDIKEINPVENVYFYSKFQPNKAFKLKTSEICTEGLWYALSCLQDDTYKTTRAANSNL